MLIGDWFDSVMQRWRDNAMQWWGRTEPDLASRALPDDKWGAVREESTDESTDESTMPDEQCWADNMFFRGGDPEHLFDVGGQRAIPEWRGRTEVDVLLERVSRGVKPVASIVLHSNGRGHPEGYCLRYTSNFSLAGLLRAVEEQGLASAQFENE